MLPRSLALALLALVALTLVVPGCKPAAGKSCGADDKPTCVDGNTLLECKSGTWRSTACLGPKGCAVDAKSYSCDTSVGRVGDACSDEKSLACTADKKTQLRCKGGKWKASAQCTGESGCSVSSFFAMCPGAVHVVGDECEPPKDAASKSFSCSTDRKAVLLCKGGQWKSVERCLGKNGCDPSAISVRCDGPVGAAGELCDVGDKPDYACSPDGKAEMVCAASGWKVEHKCLGKKGCSASVLGVECDRSIVELGEVCAKEGNAACSTDGKTILECKGGKFTKSKVCPRGCKLESIFVSCN
jgi:hypothetical protein